MSEQSTNTCTNSKEPPSAPPVDFKYEKDVCALSWWEPVRLLDEGSISDIHLVKRRDKFLKVRYQEKRNVMALAKRHVRIGHRLFGSRNNFDGQSEDEDSLRVLKSIHKDHIGRESILDEMRSEILVMSHLQHPNIVRLYEAYERRRHIYLVMEYCPGGNLTNRSFTENQARIIVRKLLSALTYMHSKGVVHRDIKLENIMFDRHGEIKVIDFGLATKYLSDEFSNMTDTVGTLYSMAPQVLEGRGYDSKCDLWSLGVVTYKLLSGQQPFWGTRKAMPWAQRRIVMIDLIKKCDYAPMVGMHWKGISQLAKDFVRSLLQYKAEDRPTAARALELPWLQQSSAPTVPTAITNSSTDNDSTTLDRFEGSTVGASSSSNTALMMDHEDISDFRREAWSLLAGKLDLNEIDNLQNRLEETDTSGSGYVPVQLFLELLHDVPSLPSEDVQKLGQEWNDSVSDEKELSPEKTRFPYIDFMIEVRVGRRRNIMEAFAKDLDELDTEGTRRVNLDQISRVVEGQKRLSHDLKDSLHQHIQSMKDDDGNVSTVEVLEWFGKRIAREQRDSVRSPLE